MLVHLPEVMQPSGPDAYDEGQQSSQYQKHSSHISALHALCTQRQA
jgi:hypothetical protein